LVADEPTRSREGERESRAKPELMGICANKPTTTYGLIGTIG